MITSLQHPLVKHLVRLRQNRDYREEHGTAFIEGVKMVTEVCESVMPKNLIVAEQTEIPSTLQQKQMTWVSQEVMKKISGTLCPEGIVAEVPMPAFSTLADKKRILVLDNVQDPGNLGTLIRTALAFNWEGVFLLNECCDPYNEKALRASKGATFRLPMGRGNWDELNNKKLPLYAADLTGESVTHLKFPKAFMLILGSEAHGLSQEIKDHSHPITIPQSGSMESLNVAVAGGILMYLATL